MGFKEESEKLLSGEPSIREHHPFFPSGESEEVADGVVFFPWFANFSAIKTDEGLVMVDTGGTQRPDGRDAPAMVAGAGQHRYLHPRRRRSCCEHELDRGRGRQKRRARAARRRPSRDRRAFRSFPPHRGLQRLVNRASSARRLNGPKNIVYPDTYFDHQYNVAAGNLRFECHHARGETDDHCWVFMPQAKVLLTGDFMIWAAPTTGNPAKGARYVREWAEALRAMAKSGAEVLLPGHGIPVFGAIRMRQVLNETAEYLQSIYDQTFKLMNDGAPLDDIVHSVKPPAALAERPYLQPIYGEPEYIVRNM